MNASWKTTAAGLVVILLAILTQARNLLDSDPATVFDLDAVLAAGAGIGLLFARDNNVSSEQAGVKK